MKKRNSFVWTSIVVLISIFVIAGCKETPTDSDGLPTDPGSGNLAGKVVGTVAGQPIAGVVVSVGAVSTTTDTKGIFRLDGVGQGTLAVVIGGTGIYTHTAAVNTANGRSVQLDAIETNSNFNLGFYREFARGNHPNEGNLYPTHRWMNSKAPTFYISTNTTATVAKIVDQSLIDRVRNVISQMVPIWTGNVYRSVSVTTQDFPLTFDFSYLPDNSFVIAFDDTVLSIGAYGVGITDPTILSAATSSINKAIIFMTPDLNSYALGEITLEEVVAHEMGHAFGFRHTSLLPSVMLAVGAYGGMYSPFDQLHAAIVYKRPAGNMDIDNDPIPGAKMMGQSAGREVFIDNRATFSKSPELLRQLQSLRGHDLVRQVTSKY